MRKMRSEVTELKKMVVTTKSKLESLVTQVHDTVLLWQNFLHPYLVTQSLLPLNLSTLHMGN